MTDLVAFDFLPDNLQVDNDLYPWLGPLIDWALPPPSDLELFPIEPLIERLNVKYADTEAVNAYFNKFIKPIIGTRPAMEFAFQLIGTQATLIEWFQSDVPVPRFKFIIEFDQYPGLLDFDALLDLIMALKNERSWPTVIRMAECADNLILDYGSLDTEPMDASEGYINELGVVICLFQHYKTTVTPVEVEELQGYIGRYAQYYEHGFMRWDYSDYDEKWDEFWATIIGARGSISAQLIRYVMPYETCAVEADLSELGYCRASLFDRSSYHTGTFEAQMVLSDWGTLSGGEGFIGSYETVENTMYLDDPDSQLDNIKGVLTPIIQFWWIQHGVQHLEPLGIDGDVLLEATSTAVRSQQIFYEPSIAEGLIACRSGAGEITAPATWTDVFTWDDFSGSGERIHWFDVNQPSAASSHKTQSDGSPPTYYYLGF